MTFTDELLFSIEANISRCGWHATAVFGGPEPPWVYTIGVIETWRHPELIVFGLDTGSAHWLLSAVVDDLKAGVVHTPGRDNEFDLQGTRVCLLPVSDCYWSPTYDYLLLWRRYYRARDPTCNRKRSSWRGATRRAGSPGRTASRRSSPDSSPSSTAPALPTLVPRRRPATDGEAAGSRQAASPRPRGDDPPCPTDYDEPPARQPGRSTRRQVACATTQTRARSSNGQSV